MRTAASFRDTGTFVLERLREQPRRRRERDVLAQRAREAYVAAGGRSPTGGEWIWNAHRVTWVRHDCVVKVPRSSYGEAALRRDLSVRTRIHADPTWSSWRPLVAGTLREQAGANHFAVVEERLTGVSLLGLMHDAAVMGRVRDELAQARLTTSHQVLADERVFAWFLRPAATVSDLLRRRGQGRAADAVTRWATHVASSVEGSTCHVVLVHGDLWPGNILVRHGRSPAVIDWDQASFHDAALHDLLHLTLYPVCRERRVDLGLLIRRLLAGPGEEQIHADLDRTGLDDVLTDVGVAKRDALIWYWLRHVNRMIGEPGHANNPRWVNNNVLAVATTITQGRESL